MWYYSHDHHDQLGHGVSGRSAFMRSFMFSPPNILLHVQASTDDAQLDAIVNEIFRFRSHTRDAESDDDFNEWNYDDHAGDEDLANAFHVKTLKRNGLDIKVRLAWHRGNHKFKVPEGDGSPDGEAFLPLDRASPSRGKTCPTSPESADRWVPQAATSTLHTEPSYHL